MDNTQNFELAYRLGTLLSKRSWLLATAESCTGGGLGELLTCVPGSSSWYVGGMISYSNRAKHDLLGIDEAFIDTHGAVSEAVAKAMAQGAARCLATDISVAISGIAGPKGGSADKPVGTVWLSWYVHHGDLSAKCYVFKGDRQSVRAQAQVHAIEGLLQILLNNKPN